MSTKKQHFVPKLLLRGFADGNEKLFAYDKVSGRSFPTTVDDAGHQNHFLTVSELDGAGGAGAYYETLFQAYEGHAATALRDLRAALANGVTFAIDAPQRLALSQFLTVQYLRTPASREQTFQFVEQLREGISTEILSRNGFDITSDEIVEVIKEFAYVKRHEEKKLHGELLLNSDFIAEFAEKLSTHVWLLGIAPSNIPLYLSDHPVTYHAHVPRPGRGTGPMSYGVEVVMPLESRLQLSMVHRRFVTEQMPHLESLDGSLYSRLTPQNVLYQRSLQVQSSARFIYCTADDFEDAEMICSQHPELRDPLRPRSEATIFGEASLPRRRE